MLENWNQTVGNNCWTNADSNCILGRVPEFLNFMILLEPFEEQLNLSSVPMKFSYLQWGKFCNIRKKNELLLLPIFPRGKLVDIVRIIPWAYISWIPPIAFNVTFLRVLRFKRVALNHMFDFSWWWNTILFYGRYEAFYNRCKHYQIL